MSNLRDDLIKEGLVAANIEDSYAISWLDTGKTLFSTQTKVYANDTWMNVGNEQKQEFLNTPDGIVSLNENVPDPYKTAILTVWNTVNKS
jgi:hypothetical protein